MQMRDILRMTEKWAADPARIALVESDGKEMTYAELETRVNAIARHILDTYSGSAPIVVYGDKENDMAVAVLAILKSGRACTVIASYHPQSRAETILELCKPAAIIAPIGTKYEFPGYDVITSADIDTYVSSHDGQKIPEEHWVNGEDVACIIFTSGSTGIPKGVVISAANVASKINHAKKYHSENINIVDSFPSVFIGYIVNILMYLALLGSTAYSVKKELSTDIASLIEVILKANPEAMTGTPALYEMFLADSRFNESNLTSLKTFTSVGETMTSATAKKLKEKFPKVSLLNGYGLSETTACGLDCKYTDEIIERDYQLPSGTPIENVEAILVDANGNEVADGETGELLIISDTVALGYLNNPEKTAEVFFKTADGRRGVHTRDLMFKKNGLYYYVGRVDNMIKIGGNRVEAEEIERAVLLNPAVKACVAVPIVRDGKTSAIAAYTVMKEPVESKLKATIELKKFLKDRLPSYMIPQQFIFTDAIPKNTNGKTDRPLLKDMASKL